MLRPFARSLRTTLLLHYRVEIGQFYSFLGEIKDFVSDCLRCCFKDICSQMFNILIKLERVQIPILFYYYILQITPTT